MNKYVECTILPEDFNSNYFCNIRGGEFGCPIDRAIFRAGIKLVDNCYVHPYNILIHNQIESMGIEEDVQAQFRTQIFRPITFFLYIQTSNLIEDPTNEN